MSRYENPVNGDEFVLYQEDDGHVSLKCPPMLMLLHIGAKAHRCFLDETGVTGGDLMHSGEFVQFMLDDTTRQLVKMMGEDAPKEVIESMMRADDERL